MKKIFYLLVITTFTFSCESELEKVAPFISEDSVFEEARLTEAYIAELYDDLRFFDTRQSHSIGIISCMGGEYTALANWQSPNQAVRRNYSPENGSANMDFWAYETLRELNTFIEGIVTSSSFSQEYINTKLAEAKFLRAYLFFDMVRRYGGVPIITTPQTEDDPIEELYPARNSEQEVYDFIYNELEETKSLFTNTKTGAVGQADKYAAMALQSRAMLYAGSIATFGDVQLNGLLGIPASEAEAYYQKSYNASKELIDSGMFSLYNVSSDPVKNFSDMFLVEGNDEVIFAEVFEPITHGHSLDLLGTPEGFPGTWNSNWQVNYDIVERFEFMDGRPDIDRADLNSTNLWDVDDFFGNRDPRLRASVFYPESVYEGLTLYFHSASIVNGNEVTSGTVINVNNEAIPAAGGSRMTRRSSMLLRKKLNLSAYAAIADNSGQDMYVFRYGEILLNYAEASHYLGKFDESKEAVNQIRTRAGMFLKDVVGEEEIRREREVELAFEEHRYWDMKRWRLADTDLNQNKKGCTFKYYPDQDLYTIELRNDVIGNNRRRFGEERYYLPLRSEWIADNPKLLQNPGY
ncbi:RagB/SusD family nutrient uptake outer membrane protein [Seonamhaeicola sp.]|uniref:RagB/SusD family nutrient uptake outer membrane protein n=1 Tax=Seonamhaeicola sp. TaxID=1912245 RepID=UPI00260FFD33|nr:RagB/SusD family nutrient uptake outer membrane protein [Seonamhaeicola sp.]